MAIKKIRYSLNSITPDIQELGVGLKNVKIKSSEYVDSENSFYLAENVMVDFSNTNISSEVDFPSFSSALQAGLSMHHFQAQHTEAREGDVVDNSSYSVLSYGIKPVYNYYAPQYEMAVEDLTERQILNAYISARNGNSDQFSEQRHFGNSSLAKKVFMKAMQGSVDYLPAGGVLTEEDSIIYPMEYNFGDINSYKDKFPFGVDFSIGVDNRNNKFKSFLKKANMYETFVHGYLLLNKSVVTFNTSYSLQMEPQFEGKMVSTLDLSDIDYETFMALPPSPSKQYFKRDQGSLYGMGLKLALLRGFFRQLSTEETPSFKDIVVGKKNYYEPIFYKIRKIIGPGGQISVQDYIIPASGNIITYFDSQIKQGVIYSYEIVECAITVGSRISNLQNLSYNQGKTDFTIHSEPVISMVETVIVRDGVVAACDPTQPPIINFYTRNDFENKIFMRLATAGVGEIHTDYDEIIDSDLQNTVMLTYKNRSLGNYRFSNKNNKVLAYQIMKLDFKPQRLEDFRNANVYLINERVSFNSALVSMKIRPNTKHYYLCRTINQHNMISNHSVIYEVELLKSSSSSRIVVSTYKFVDKIKDYQFRTMGRLLQVIPASIHTSYDLEEEVDSYKRILNKSSLGAAEYPIWGEKFKIRLTSNNTGRKIDFNLDFNLIRKKTIEETK